MTWRQLLPRWLVPARLISVRRSRGQAMKWRAQPERLDGVVELRGGRLDGVKLSGWWCTACEQLVDAEEWVIVDDPERGDTFGYHAPHGVRAIRPLGRRVF